MYHETSGANTEDWIESTKGITILAYIEPYNPMQLIARDDFLLSSIRVNEIWISNNPEIKASFERALEDARQGHTTRITDLNYFLNSIWKIDIDLFSLDFTDESRQQLAILKRDNSRQTEYRAVKKALNLLQRNPRHNSLESHIYYSIKGPSNEKVFESYAQQNRPNPYRIFWYYGPDRGVITILNIVPHP